MTDLVIWGHSREGKTPKRLTSALCTYFRLLLTTVLLESTEGETKVGGQTEY